MLPVFLRLLDDLSRFPVILDSSFLLLFPTSVICSFSPWARALENKGFFKKKDSYNLSLISLGGDGAFERVLAQGVGNLNTNLRKI